MNGNEMDDGDLVKEFIEESDRLIAQKKLVEHVDGARVTTTDSVARRFDH